MQLINPYVWLLVFTSLISLFLIALVGQRRTAPGAHAMLVVLVGIIIWSLGYSLELISASHELMLLWDRVQYIGIVMVPAAWFYFAVSYTRRGWPFSVPATLLMPLLPAALLLLIWTNELHHLFYRSTTSIDYQGMALLSFVPGPIFWVNVVYGYVLVAVGTLILLLAMTRRPQLLRGRLVMVLSGVTIPFLGNVLYLMRLTAIDITPIGFAIAILVLSISIVRYRMFYIIPSARSELVEQLEDPVLLVDDQNIIMDANQAARNLFSPTRGDLLGRSIEVVFSPWNEALQPYMNATKVRAEVNLGNTEDGLWFELHISPFITDKRDHMLGKLIIFYGISTRKQMQRVMAEAHEEALQASLVKSRLITNVSQDLRTPLNVIQGYTEMLLEGHLGQLDVEQIAVLHRVLAASYQMSISVGDLLDQTLIEKDALEIIPETFQPQQIGAAVTATLGAAAAMKKLELRVELDPQLPSTLYGDLSRIQQLVISLTHNAIRFTNEGWVEVRLVRSGEEDWLIEVADTGLGIPKEARSYIFEPFRQGQHTFGRYTGSGLGLSVVKYLVTQMGGHIEVQSHFGLGSTFRVYLPLVSPPGGDSSSGDAVTRTASPSEPGLPAPAGHPGPASAA